MWLLALHGASCAAAQTPFAHISAARPARSFFAGERVVLSVQAPGARQVAHCTIRDYRGAEVRRTRMTVGSDVPQRLDLGSGWDLGIYYLEFHFSSGAQQTDAFCVLPRPDYDRGEYDLFSWHCASEDGNLWRALAQVGCRVIRRDIAWPNVEPSQGQFDLSLPSRLVALARQSGIQLIPILGYTPVWAGEQPVNATGRAAGATHTWAPRSSAEWQEYAATLADYLAGQTLTWPAAGVLDPLPVSQQETLPVVHSWEIWNEVDQAFFYGYWHRYLDLLRIAYGEVKRRDPWGPVLYGGSTGHWTELGMTYNANAQWFFDRLAFHPGGDNPDYYLEMYYTGAPQIGNAYGIYRPATMTECYPTPPAGVTHTQYQMRLYALLRKWQVEGYCVEYGMRLVAGPDPDSPGMLHYHNGTLLPNAKYVAFAVARWLLCDAVYAGPLSPREGATGLVFLRPGGPVVVAWADTPVTVSLPARAGAYAVDEMGRRRPLTVSEGQATVELNPVAQALCGLDLGLVAQALHNQVEIYLTTPQGFVSSRAFGYIGPLERDAAWAGAGWPERVRALTAAAEQEIAQGRLRGGAAIGEVQEEVYAQLHRGLGQFIANGAVDGRGDDFLWRMQTFGEYLGRVADAYERSLGTRPPRNGLEALEAGIGGMLPQVQNPESGLIWPLALQSLQRARTALHLARRTGGSGALAAAQGNYQAAQQLRQVEQARLLGVVAAPDFHSATQLVKAMALVPGRTHELRVFVYNFTTAPVSGTLIAELPTEWGVTTLTAPFSAPAQGRSEAVELSVNLPGEGTWELKSAWTPVGHLQLNTPASLRPGVDLYLRGELDDGRRLLRTQHYTLVGELAQ